MKPGALQLPLLADGPPRSPLGDRKLSDTAIREPLSPRIGSGEERVVVRELLLFLVREIEKQRHFQHLPLYLVFLALLTSLMLVTRDVFAPYSDGLQMTNEAHSTLAVADLTAVSAASGFLPWVRIATAAIWDSGLYSTGCDSRDAVHNVPLSLVMIRQWRVSRKDCPSPPPLAPSDRERVPCSCMPKYTSDDQSEEPFGPGVGQPWVTDNAAGAPHHSVGVETPLHHFTSTASQFSLSLLLSINRTNMSQQLDELETNAWVDAATRLVAVDALFLNPSTDKLAYVTAFLEVLPSGVTFPGVHTFIFDLVGLDNDVGRGTLALDILVTLSIPVFLYGLYMIVQLRRRCDPGAFPFVGPVEVFELGFIVALIILMQNRIRLWVSLAAIMNSEDFSADARDAGFGDGVGAQEKFTFHRMAAHAELTVLARTRLAVALVLSYLRVFKYFQHFTLLNMLTETVRRAFWELVRLLLIWVVILCGYSGGACVLYGQDVDDFETLSKSFSFLVRILFQVGQDTEFSWKRMKDVSPSLTPWFMGSYYGLSFLLLLNMILAAIVSSFTQVQHARDEADRKEEKREDLLKSQLMDIRKSQQIGGAGAAVGLRGAVWARMRQRCAELTGAVCVRVTDVANRVTGRAEHDPRRHEQTVRELKRHCEARLRLPVEDLDSHPQLYKCLKVTIQELCDVVRDADAAGLARVFWETRRREIERSDVLLHLYECVDRLCDVLAGADRGQKEVRQRWPASVSPAGSHRPPPPSPPTVLLADPPARRRKESRKGRESEKTTEMEEAVNPEVAALTERLSMLESTVTRLLGAEGEATRMLSRETSRDPPKGTTWDPPNRRRSNRSVAADAALPATADASRPSLTPAAPDELPCLDGPVATAADTTAAVRSTSVRSSGVVFASHPLVPPADGRAFMAAAEDTIASEDSSEVFASEIPTRPLSLPLSAVLLRRPSSGSQNEAMRLI